MPAAKPAEPETAGVVLDLLEEDQMAREAAAAPLPVRLPGTGETILVPHISDWPHRANRYATVDAWDLWASAVLSEEDQKKFAAADLRNRHVARIYAAVTASAGASPGKSQRSAS